MDDLFVRLIINDYLCSRKSKKMKNLGLLYVAIIRLRDWRTEV